MADRGRPKLPETRRRTVAIRTYVTEQQAASLYRLARHRRESLSELLLALTSRLIKDTETPQS